MDGAQLALTVRKVFARILIGFGVLAFVVVLCLAYLIGKPVLRSGLSAGSAGELASVPRTAMYQNASIGDSGALSPFASIDAMNRGVSEVSTPTAASNALPEVQERKIVRTGSLSLFVEDMDGVVSDMQGIVERLGGFVSELSVSGKKQGERSGYVIMRVPAATFDIAMTEIKGKASFVRDERISAKNVTEEYIDLTARIGNKKAREAALNDLLSRGTKMSDLIEVENEIERVRSEIESLEGRQKYLDTQADFSTISVTLTENQQVVTVDDSLQPWDTLTRAVNALFSIAGKVLLGLAVFAIAILPFLLVFVFTVYGVFRFGLFIARKLFS